MTWPTGPPPMPPSGWYDDPEHPWTWRYWDGARWTDHRAPMWVAPQRDPRSFSVWFERSVAAAKVAFRRVGVLLLSLWVVLGVSATVSAIAVLDGERGRELRDLLEIDETTFGATGSSSTFELTTAEADRAWELVRQLFASAIPWMLLLGVAFVALWTWSVALVTQVVQRQLDDPLVGAPSESLAVPARRAVSRMPAVLASGIVVFGLFAVVWVIAALPVLLVAVAGGSGVAIASTVVFGVLLAGVATAWLWGRLTLASVIAASGGFGLGVRRSWAITHGQFWFVVGRLLIVGLIAAVPGGLVNIVNGLGQFLGFVAYVAVVLLLQAVAATASIIVTVCGHLVTVDQAAARDATSR